MLYVQSPNSMFFFVSDAKAATWSFGVEDYGTLGNFCTWKLSPFFLLFLCISVS